MDKTLKRKLKKANRVWEIDCLRGVSVFLRILDHRAFDFAYLLPQRYSNFWTVKNPFIRTRRDFCYGARTSSWELICHYIFSALFFILSGISCSFSRNNFRHSLKIRIGCLLLDAVTYLAYYATQGSFDSRILFGVLFALGRGVFFVSLIDRIFKDDARLLFRLAFVIFIFCISQGLYSKENYIEEIASWSDIPALLLGTESFGADFFPLVPYLAPMFLGASFGKVFYKDKKTKLPRPHAVFEPFCFIGRNTMWVYLFHQPIRISIRVLITLRMGYRF